MDETDSTMADAARRAATLAGPTWIMAHRQSSPHGRRGRAWRDAGGNFAATLVYRPVGGLEQAALRSFVAAVSLYFTIGLMIDRDRLSLKWPNDVLLDGGKVAGILLQSSGPAEAPLLSIGIGVNLVSSPDQSEVEEGATRPVSILGAGGKPETPESFLSFLAGHYDQHERLFAEFGFDPIRRLWLRHAAKLGEVITARTTRDTFTGRFETVDANGHLVLNTATGRKAIAAADVYF